MPRILALSLFLYCSTPIYPQSDPGSAYPQNYFRNPLDIPIRLAANFGELRQNHFHMGLDIKTEMRINLPVYAAADGWIARVKVEPEGFGQAIYINHPNGYTTVYAHLNEFFPKLAAYVKKEQYRLESWAVSLEIPNGMFKVRKGDLIARSGNTGGSEGPHLHFEIRRTSDDINLNPMLFGLPIPDQVAPVIQRLAIYDGSTSIYEQSPRQIPVRNNAGDSFSIPLVTAFSKIRFGISAFDQQSGSTNPNGIFEAILFDNEQRILSFQMNNISYDHTLNVNAHIDYKTRAQGGQYIQQLFLLPGCNPSIYRTPGGNGVIDISDGRVHSIRVEVKDAYANTSRLHFIIRYKENGGTVSSRIYGGNEFYPGMLGAYESGDCAFYIGERGLYDSVHINYSRVAPTSASSISARHRIGADYIPLQDTFLLRIKPSRELNDEEKSKVLLERETQEGHDVRKPQWQAGWASAGFRGFGVFELVVDGEAPEIIPIGFKEGSNLKNAVQLKFLVRDNTDSYKNFRAELDGKWLRFSNDKGKYFIYRFDEHCPRGSHELTVSVEDEAGNIARKRLRFMR
jgi:hypothetical protein